MTSALDLRPDAETSRKQAQRRVAGRIAAMGTGPSSRGALVPARAAAEATIGGEVFDVTLDRLGVAEVEILVKPANRHRVSLDCAIELALPVGPGSNVVNALGTVTTIASAEDIDGEEVLACGVVLDDGQEAALQVFADHIAAHKDTILLVGADRVLHQLVITTLARAHEIVSVPSVHDALEVLHRQHVAVVVVVDDLPTSDAVRALRTLSSKLPGHRAPKLAISSSGEPMARRFTGPARVFYLLTKPVVPEDLEAIVGRAVRKFREDDRARPARVVDDAEQATRTLEISRQLARQKDLSGAGQVATQAIESLVHADRAYCYLYDSPSETLWTVGDKKEDGHTKLPVSGLVGFAAQTAMTIRLDAASSDAKFRKEIDDPHGGDGARLLIQPVTTSDRNSLAVLVAARTATRPPFTEEEAATLERLARQCALTFAQMTVEAKLERVRREQEPDADAPTVFRREALAFRGRAEGGEASVLRIAPEWTGYAFKLLIAVVVAFLVFGVVANVDEYASGPAIVRVDGRIDLTTKAAGVVAAVLVQPGQRVEGDQLLVRFHDTEEVQQLERISKEFDLTLIKVLANPADPGPRESLGRLRAERDLATARRGERTLRAPSAGVINDVRIRAGQHLALGTPILSVSPEGAALSIVSLMPGHYRPMLSRGLSIRYEVSGFRYSYRELVVEEVGDEVIGPDEARRYLGADVADAVQVSGPVILVRAKLPARTFASDGRVFNYHDGMPGMAEVRVRTEPVLLMLVPGLRRVFGGTN